MWRSRSPWARIGHDFALRPPRVLAHGRPDGERSRRLSVLSWCPEVAAGGAEADEDLRAVSPGMAIEPFIAWFPAGYVGWDCVLCGVLCAILVRWGSIHGLSRWPCS